MNGATCKAKIDHALTRSLDQAIGRVYLQEQLTFGMPLFIRGKQWWNDIHAAGGVGRRHQFPARRPFQFRQDTLGFFLCTEHGKRALVECPCADASRLWLVYEPE